MDDHQINFNLIDYLIMGLTTVFSALLRLFHVRLRDVEKEHDRLKDDVHTKYVAKEDYRESMRKLEQTIEKNHIILSTKIDSLFIPKTDGK